MKRSDINFMDGYIQHKSLIIQACNGVENKRWGKECWTRIKWLGCIKAVSRNAMSHLTHHKDINAYNEGSWATYCLKTDVRTVTHALSWMMVWQCMPFPHLQVPLRQVGALAHCLIDGVIAHEDSAQACLLHPSYTLSTACTDPVLTPCTPQAKYMLTGNLQWISYVSFTG